MSVNLTDAAVVEFDNEVKHAYQGMGVLRNTVTVRNGVVGNSYRFVSMGRGLAGPRGMSSADVAPMNIEYDRQIATLTDWIAPEYTDIFDQAEVNFDEKRELAMTIAKALSRREDQIIIDAFNRGTYTEGAGGANEGFAIEVEDGSTTQNFSLEYLRQAREIMQRQEIDPMNQHIALRAPALQKLLEDPEVTSSDYNTVKALVMGDLDSYYGFKFHIIGDRVEAGLPGAAASRVAYAYVMDSLGLAIGIDMKTSIDYVPQKLSWLCVGMLKAGAVIRDPKGIIRMTYNEGA